MLIEGWSKVSVEQESIVKGLSCDPADELEIFQMVFISVRHRRWVVGVPRRSRLEQSEVRVEHLPRKQLIPLPRQPTRILSFLVGKLNFNFAFELLRLSQHDLLVGLLEDVFSVDEDVDEIGFAFGSFPFELSFEQGSFVFKGEHVGSRSSHFDDWHIKERLVCRHMFFS